MQRLALARALAAEGGMPSPEPSHSVPCLLLRSAHMRIVFMFMFMFKLMWISHVTAMWAPQYPWPIAWLHVSCSCYSHHQPWVILFKSGVKIRLCQVKFCVRSELNRMSDVT